MLPGRDVDRATMLRTLDWIWANWSWPDTWGWDYPLVAMSAARLGQPERAVEALLLDTPKNRHRANGHNHQRPGRTIYDWRHYLSVLQRKPGALRNGAPFMDLPEPLQRLRRALLRESGGDRLMAKVLALVPAAGLDAVLVAVELALEGAPPSGRVSAEHVVNVLARLNAAPRPANVATMLQVLTPPIADTARYDRLRDLQEADHA